MMTNLDLASFSHAELVALVQDLQQRLAECERQREELKNRLRERTTARQPSTEAPPGIEEGPASGSQEDLLAHLEKIYPEG